MRTKMSVTEPGDVFMLKLLCEQYGLKDVVARLNKGQLKPARECGAGKCDNNCTTLCATCYTCPPNCAIKA